MIESFIFIVYALSFIVVSWIIDPIQSFFLKDVFLGSLIFLPHGVRVVATWLFMRRAVLPLVFGDFILCFAVWQIDAPIINVMIASTIGGISAFVVIKLFESAGIQLSSKNYRERSLFNWKMILLISTISSFINSIGAVYAFRATLELNDELAQLTAFLIGDTIGALAMLIVSMLFFRYRRFYRKRRN